MENQKENQIFNRNQKGQTFLEFIFVILTMISLSMIFIRGINGLVAKRWEVMVKIIAQPNSSEVEIR